MHWGAHVPRVCCSWSASVPGNTEDISGAPVRGTFSSRGQQAQARCARRRCLAAQAKYGEKNQIVDIDVSSPLGCVGKPTLSPSWLIPPGLQNLEDTTGNWELYGREDPKRYPSLQNEFFERAAGPLERREVLASLLALGALHNGFVSNASEQGPAHHSLRDPTSGCHAARPASSSCIACCC